MLNLQWSLTEEKAVISHQTPAENGQVTRLIEIVRKLGVNEDEAMFKAKLAVIARQKPKNKPTGGDNE